MTRVARSLALVAVVLFRVPAAAAQIHPTPAVEVLPLEDLAHAVAAAPVMSPPAAALVPARPRVLASMYVGLVALQGYDIYSTHSALKLGAVEINPVLAGKMANPAVQIAVKGAVTAFSIYTAEKLWKRKQRVAAVALMAATNSLMAVVAASNASVLRGQR